LEAFGHVERLEREFVAFLDGAGNEQHVFGIAVGEVVGGEDVALAGARGQAGAGSHALDVDDHAGDFGEVGEAGHLGHERDAGAGSGGHRSRAHPAGAEDHADGGDFVLGLDDGVGGFAGFGVFAGTLSSRLVRFRTGSSSA
jgi:hypothetical protein